METNKLFSLIIILLNISIANAQWQKTNGPYHSDIKAFAKHASNLYAVGESDGAFLSTNNGASWTQISNDLPTHTIYYSIAVDSTKLFLGTNKGIFSSINGGDNWLERNNGLPENVRVYSLLIDGSTIYAGTTMGIFLSNNNGDNWVAVNNGLPTNTIVGSFVVNGSNIYAGTSDGVYLSTNNGDSWTPKNNGIPTEIYVYSFAIAGANIYAGTSDGVYLSTDTGNSWMDISNGLMPSFGKWLQISGTNLYVGTPTGLFVSTNNGSSWNLLRDGLTNHVYTNTSTTAIMINGPDIFAGGNNGISLSSDGGATWNYANNGLPYTGVFTLGTNGEAVYVGTEKGLFVLENMENSWLRKFNYFTSSVKAREANIYIGSNFGNIFVSNNYGEDWTLSTGFFDNGEEVMAVAGSTVFAKYNGGTGFISTDNGATFNIYDLPYAVFANRDDATLFAVDNNVLEYNGEDWVTVSSAINNDTVYSLAVNSSTFIIGTDGGVLTSAYNGSSWTKVDFGLANAKVTSLAVNGPHVYACTSNNDIFLSSDNGNNWSAVTDNFTDTIIAKNPYGTNTTQLLINNIHIFVAAEQGIWLRPLSEITSTRAYSPNINFRLYPNPSSGRFTISGNEMSSIVVHNVLGEIIYGAYNRNITSMEIDLSAFPKGIYFVTFHSEGKMHTKKVIIQ